MIATKAKKLTSHPTNYGKWILNFLTDRTVALLDASKVLAVRKVKRSNRRLRTIHFHHLMTNSLRQIGGGCQAISVLAFYSDNPSSK